MLVSSAAAVLKAPVERASGFGDFFIFLKKSSKIESSPKLGQSGIETKRAGSRADNGRGKGYTAFRRSRETRGCFCAVLWKLGGILLFLCACRLIIACPLEGSRDAHKRTRGSRIHSVGLLVTDRDTRNKLLINPAAQPLLVLLLGN